MTISRSVITKYPFIEDWSILLAYRGSIAHGMYLPPGDPHSTDDKDVHGICIPPPEYYYGLKSFGSKGTKEIFEGEWDIVLFELTKAIRLLAAGNPNILSILWLNPEHYIKITPAGRLLLENRHLFVGKHVHKSFVGYASGQLHRMTHSSCKGYMGAKRKSLVEKYRYDTNNAAHLIRLLRMGIEFLSTGEMVVTRPDAQELLAIKRGEWSLEHVQREADSLFAQSRQALIASKLPDNVDCDAISELSVRIADEWRCAKRNAS